MPRNMNPYFPFYHRDWLESERVARMSLAARGLYIGALALQGVHGSIPSDLKELALKMFVRPAEMKTFLRAWSEVAPHFVGETVDGQERLYHPDLRAMLVTRSNLREARRSYGKLGGETRAANAAAKPKAAPKAKAKAQPKASVHASDSDSESEVVKETPEQSFERFYKAYPRKVGKSIALSSWVKLDPDAELVEKIIAHVERRKTNDPCWLKDNGQYILHPSTFLNQRRWEDDYLDGTSGRGAGYPRTTPPMFGPPGQGMFDIPFIGEEGN